VGSGTSPSYSNLLLKIEGTLNKHNRLSKTVSMASSESSPPSSSLTTPGEPAVVQGDGGRKRRFEYLLQQATSIFFDKK